MVVRREKIPTPDPWDCPLSSAALCSSSGFGSQSFANMSAPSSLLLLLLASVPAAGFMAPLTRAHAPSLSTGVSSRALRVHSTAAESSSQDHAERSPSPIALDSNKIATAVLTVTVGASVIGTVSQFATIVAGVVAVVLVVAALLNESLAGASVEQPADREAEVEPMECYLVDGIESDGKQVVVCTPEPEEFCWFHGIQVCIVGATRACACAPRPCCTSPRSPRRACVLVGAQRSALQPTESSDVQGTLQCEEDASYRGTREYWCR